MSKVRGFEVVRGCEKQDIQLPMRQTVHSAGYDFESAEDVTIPPIWQHIFQVLISKLSIVTDPHEHGKLIKPTLVRTGVKAYMPKDEALFLYNRSSNPIKKFLLLTNGVGVVDSDYYENDSNDGHIMFQFINFGITDKQIKKGERIGQGVFQKFLKADNDVAHGQREGGHGST